MRNVCILWYLSLQACMTFSLNYCVLMHCRWSCLLQVSVTCWWYSASTSSCSRQSWSANGGAAVKRSETWTGSMDVKWLPKITENLIIGFYARFCFNHTRLSLFSLWSFKLKSLTTNTVGPIQLCPLLHLSSLSAYSRLLAVWHRVHRFLLWELGHVTASWMLSTVIKQDISCLLDFLITWTARNVICLTHVTITNIEMHVSMFWFGLLTQYKSWRVQVSLLIYVCSHLYYSKTQQQLWYAQILVTFIHT